MALTNILFVFSFVHTEGIATQRHYNMYVQQTSVMIRAQGFAHIYRSSLVRVDASVDIKFIR